jgi:hypothetical protein
MQDYFELNLQTLIPDRNETPSIKTETELSEKSGTL